MVLADHDDEQEVTRLLGLAMQLSSVARYYSDEGLDVWGLESKGEIQNWLRVYSEIWKKRSDIDKFISDTRALHNQYIKLVHKKLGLGEEYVDQHLDGLVRFAYALGVFEGRRSAMDVEKQVEVLTNASSVARRKRNEARLHAASRQKGEPVRNAARAYLEEHKHASQNEVARHVASTMHKDQRGVWRTIEPLFERRELKASGRTAKRARPPDQA